MAGKSIFSRIMNSGSETITPFSFRFSNVREPCNSLMDDPGIETGISP
jgi:hypothetical protein